MFPPVGGENWCHCLGVYAFLGAKGEDTCFFIFVHLDRSR